MSSQHKSKRTKADALPPLTDSSNSSSSERKETKQRTSTKRSSGAPGKSAKTNSRSKNKMSSHAGSSELCFSATDECVELFGESGTTPGGLRQIEEVASSSSRSLLKKKIGRALLLKSQSAGEETKEEISAEDNNNETKLSSKRHKFKRRQSSQSTASMQKDSCSSIPNLSFSSSPSSSLSFSRDRAGRKQHKQTSKQHKHERKLPQDVETNTSVKNKIARIELSRKQQQEQLDNLASETEERTLETRLKDIVPSSPAITEEKPKKKKKHREHSDKDLTASSSDLSSSRASDLRSRSSQELSVTTPKKKVKRRSSSSASTTTKTKVRRAPASPGEDLDIKPIRRDSDNDGDKIPSPTLVKSMPTNSSRRRSSKTRKHRHYRGENVLSEGEPSLRDQRNSHSHDSSSFSKAVVAAAVNDATVHGRAFSSHDVKDKVAFEELSRDPICSKHFRNMGQSFKAKIPPPPPPPTYSPPSSPGKKQKTTTTVSASPHRATKVNRVSLSSPSSPQSLIKGHSWRDRKPFGSSVRSSVDDSCASVPGETASDAVKNILEESEIYNHELKYKVALLESVFDDVHHAPAEMDNGDDKIVPMKRRGSKKQHKKRQGALPLRDAGEVMPTITQSKGLSSLDTKDAVDVERGLGGAEGDDDATKGTISTSLMHRRSSTATIETLVRMFNVKEDRGARQRVCLIGVLIFSIIAIVITIVTGLKATNSATAEHSTLSGPTAPPTSFQQDVLPDYTQSAFENPISPQARAFYWLEHDTDRMSWSAGVARQRFVLATLFYASQGEHWKFSENWLSYDQPECDWYTHQFTSICDVAQRYHTLSLPNNSLRGTLPEEIELLSALSIVQLQDNELRGTLPSRIWSSWEHLVFMNLYNNKFSGTLSSEIGLLANSRHLNTLSFRTNQFSGAIPSELGLLALEFLSLSDNSFTSTLPADLGSLSNVREIYLYKNNFVGTIPSAIGLLTNLTRLEMHDNNLSGTVPQEICDLVSMGILTTLTVDCDKVQCTCGCDCAASKSLVRKTIFDESEGEK